MLAVGSCIRPRVVVRSRRTDHNLSMVLYLHAHGDAQAHADILLKGMQAVSKGRPADHLMLSPIMRLCFSLPTPAKHCKSQDWRQTSENQLCCSEPDSADKAAWRNTDFPAWRNKTS